MKAGHFSAELRRVGLLRNRNFIRWERTCRRSFLSLLFLCLAHGGLAQERDRSNAARFIPSYDLGDAPQQYPTVLGQDGARHTISQRMYLGSTIDGEKDGQPTIGADGDDLAGSDDEEGVTFLTAPLVSGQVANLQVVASGTGQLDAWIDFEGNGTWVEAMDQIFAGKTLVAGVNTLSFTVPAGLKGVETTYARFRFSSKGGLSYKGAAPDGEVEDYRVRIAQTPETLMDYGDVPQQYPTLLGQDGARHTISQRMYLGSTVDGEKDGQPSIGADGDDLAGFDDEDGVTFLTAPLVSGQVANLQVVASVTGQLDAWVDFEGNGSWAEAMDQIFAGKTLVAGVNTLSFTVPAGLKEVEATYARFRFSSKGGLSYKGEAPDGEVEDYRVGVRIPTQGDLGDAPDSSNNSGITMTAYPSGTVANYPTVYLAGSPPYGPFHAQPKTVAFLGAGVSLEAEADIGLDQDIVNNILPKEKLADKDGLDDGVLLPLSLPSCSTTTFKYLVTFNAPPPPNGLYVNVWFDWNRDGDWNDSLDCANNLTAREWAVQNQVILLPPTAAPPLVITHTTPSFYCYHPSATQSPIWMRITLSEKPWSSTAGTVADGGGGPAEGYQYGETEDYYLTEYESEALDFGDAPARYATGADRYPTLLAQEGARHRIQTGFFLGQGIDAELDGLPTEGASGDDLNAADDEDGVIFLNLPLVIGEVAKVRVVAPQGGQLDAWLDFGGDGSWADSGDRIFLNKSLAPGTNELSFTVPTGLKPLDVTYARFRLSRNGGLSYRGWAPDGEVEDYAVGITAPPTANLDYGDAPQQFPTLLAQDGARHAMAQRMYLGSTIDGELDGQPSIGANGDDLTGADDEDGVTFLTSPLVSGQVARVQVVASVNGQLDAWVDFDGNGSWADPGDQIFLNQTLSPGTNVLSFAVPAGLKPLEMTYARFRVSSKGGLSFKGPAEDGEVEDYPLAITAGTENCIDFESLKTGASYHVGASFTDSGVTLWVQAFQWSTGVWTSDGFVRVDADGKAGESGNELNLNNACIALKFSDCVEGLTLSYGEYGGNVNLSVNGELKNVADLDVLNGTTLGGASITVTLLGGGKGHLAVAGTINSFVIGGQELWIDHICVVSCGEPGLAYDFGDAPAKFVTAATGRYPTLLAQNGARHQIYEGFFLGKSIDSEKDGLSSLTANGDDLAGIDDEDGVSFLTRLVLGQSAKVRVTASAIGLLNAWIDFNRDGDWADQGEQIFTDQPLNAGVNELVFTVPAAIDTVGATFARFRFSSTGGLSYQGLAKDGEVEDYPVKTEALQAEIDTFPYAIARLTLQRADGAVETISLAGTSIMNVATTPEGVAADTDGNGLDQVSAEVVSLDLAGTSSFGAAQLVLDPTRASLGQLEERANNTPGVLDVPPFAVIGTAEGFFDVFFRMQLGGQSVHASQALRLRGTLTHKPSAVGEVFLSYTDQPVELFDANDRPTGSRLIRLAFIPNPPVEVDYFPDSEATVTLTLPTGASQTLALSGLTEVHAAIGANGLAGDWDGNGLDQIAVQIANLDLHGDSQLGPVRMWLDSTQLSLGQIEERVNSLPGILDLPPFAETLPGDIFFDVLPLIEVGGQVYHAAQPVRTVGVVTYKPAGPGEALATTFTQPIAVLDVSGKDTGLRLTGLTHVFLPQPRMDFGDAPRPYPTLLAVNGARHKIVSGWFLGNRIDAEINGQPNATASGDDLAGVPDDEDGVFLASPLIPGALATVKVVSSTNAFLDAWIDFNHNGSWLDAGDRIFAAKLLTPGLNVLSFTVPATAALGPAFSRWRMSDQGGLSFGGYYPIGEVEDYQLRITTQAVPLADTGVTLTVSSNSATEGDTVHYLLTVANQGPDPASQVSVVLSLPTGLTFVSATPFQGSFTLTGTAVTFDLGTLAAGASGVIDVEATANGGLDGTTSPVGGSASEGYPESYLLSASATVAAAEIDPVPANNTAVAVIVVRPRMDYGDAPRPFPTLLGVNGARHRIVAGWGFGNRVDGEADGVPSALADGDDLAGGPDDEDGISFVTPVAPSAVATVKVIASTQSALDAWIDFNRDGDWLDAGERVFVAKPLVAGVNVLTFSVPATAVNGPAMSRWRLSDRGGLFFAGYAPLGEVEDHLVTITDAATPKIDLAVTAQAAPEPVDEESTLTIKVQVTNQGTADATGVVLTHNLQPTATLLGVETFQGTSSSQPDTVTVELGTLAPNAGGLITLRYLVKGVWDDTDIVHLTSVALVSATETETDPLNNTATVMITVNRLLDFGDAPDPAYPTLLASNGARHLPSNLFLGTRIDREANGQPSGGADRDDLAGGADDEDGVTFLNPFIAGSPVNLRVVSSGPGLLNAWIDFSKNGIWEAMEQVLVDRPVVAGMNLFTIKVPENAPQGDTYARFRLSSRRGLGVTGYVSDGEVEDYRVILRPRAAAPAIGRANGLPTLSWQDGTAVLEQAEFVTGPWTEVVGAGSPLVIPTGQAHRFYRLRYAE